MHTSLDPRQNEESELALRSLATARLQGEPWAYSADQPSHAEPAAVAALALAAVGDWVSAARPARWLETLQQPNGAVGISTSLSEPHWPTALAILAWQALRKAPPVQMRQQHAQAVEKALRWSFADFGKTAPRGPQIGHDTTLHGWSWAPDTHAWLEPTCFFVLALQAAGFADHPRCRTGLKLICDRLLPEGGANYGNTFVLGQTLLPHLQPTGLALLALAGTGVEDPRIERSLDYLGASLTADTPSISLAFALLGMTAWNRRPRTADSWLQQRLHERPDGDSPYQQALLILAAATPAQQASVLKPRTAYHSPGNVP